MTIPTPEDAAEAWLKAFCVSYEWATGDMPSIDDAAASLAQAFRERDRAILDEAVLVVNGAAPFTAATNAIAALRSKVLGE